jgi:hypothetical protein
MRVRRLCPPTCVVALLAAALALASACNTRPAAPDGASKGAARVQPVAAQLLRRLQAALGGSERLAAVRDMEQHLSADTWDDRGRHLGRTVKRIRWIAPGHLRMDQVGPGNTFVLYFDGVAGWEILPGGKTAIPLSGGELRFAQKQHRDFPLKIWLADRDAAYDVTSPAPNVLRISGTQDLDDPIHRIDLTLDPRSALPLTERTLSLAIPDRPSWFETRLSDWMSIDGLRLPRRTEVFSNGARLAAITVTAVRVNSGLAIDDLAAKPSNLTPIVDP